MKTATYTNASAIRALDEDVVVGETIVLYFEVGGDLALVSGTYHSTISRRYTQGHGRSVVRRFVRVVQRDGEESVVSLFGLVRLVREVSK